MPIQNDTTRRQILYLLKRQGEMTAAELADEVGITSMGVRQHLNSLERDGLVATEVVRQQRGRPTYKYYLTVDAESLFPTRYDQLAVEILDQLADLDGPDKIDYLFEHRMNTLEREYRERMAGLDFSDQVKELARIRDEEGYMAESEQVSEEEHALVEFHCPIYAIAKRYPKVCQYEQMLFSRTLGTDVQRIEHKVAGDSRCRYMVKKISK